MAFLVVGAITVPVKPGGAELDVSEVGDRHRAFDGTYRSTVRDTPRSWSFTTAPMLSTDGDSLYTVLTSLTQPTSCDGDFLGGAVSCYPRFRDKVSIVSDSTNLNFRVQLSFALEESS